MNQATEYALRYQVPSIAPEVESVRLDQFETSEIREYLRRIDTKTLRDPARPDGGLREEAEALLISTEDLDRIETLALCGQAQHAREEVLRIVSQHIGRNL